MPADCNTNPNDFTTRQSEIHQLNAKLTYDDVMADISESRKVKNSHDNAWETLRFRMASNAATVDHFVNVAAATADQTGETSNQQTTDPIRTGVGDTLAASSYTANRAVDTATATVAVAAAGVATANQAIADAVANLVNAVTASVVAANGVAASTAAAPSPKA
jgi:hypothetical protein